MRNIEIKLSRPGQLDQQTLTAILNAAGAEFTWERRQRDTFWNTQNGWLKLREVVSESDSAQVEAELIGYRRSVESSEARPSDYHIVQIDQPEALKAALDSTLGRIGVVEKERELWIWKQTRVHLDQVYGLGAFVELETVLRDIDEPEGRLQMQECLELLQLKDAESLSTPYLEMQTTYKA